MEDGFRVMSNRTNEMANSVLILVLVEDGFRVAAMNEINAGGSACLNPCSCGRWLQRPKEELVTVQGTLQS